MVKFLEGPYGTPNKGSANLATSIKNVLDTPNIYEATNASKAIKENRHAQQSDSEKEASKLLGKKDRSGRKRDEQSSEEADSDRLEKNTKANENSREDKVKMKRGMKEDDVPRKRRKE